MKIVIASDIHGDHVRAEHVAAFADDASLVILLGDLLYHGPRNDLPPFYAPKKVIPILSSMKDRIVAVRGNCDAEVDQMVLPFPILESSKVIEIEGMRVLLHHGHHEAPVTDVDAVFSGHTHIPVLERRDGVLYLNPGSTTIPKGGNPPSLAVLEDGIIRIVNLDDGSVCAELAIKKPEDDLRL